MSVEWKGYSVSIPSFKVETDATSGKARTKYFIQVIREGKRWRASHYYSEIHKLYTKLSQLFPSECSQLSFPPKRGIGQILNNIDPKFLEQRRMALETYLIAVTSMYQPASSNVVQKFLEFPEIVRTEQDRLAAAEEFRTGRKTATKEKPPLKDAYQQFKERKVRLKKIIPKQVSLLSSAIEDEKNATDTIKEMIVNIAVDGAYFRVVRRKQDDPEESKSGGGSSMYVRLNPGLDKLCLYVPTRYADVPIESKPPAFTIPLSTIIAATVFMKTDNPPPSRPPNKPLPMISDPPAEKVKEKDPSIIESDGGRGVSTNDGQLVVRFVYAVPNTVVEDGDSCDEGDGNGVVDLECSDPDIALSFADAVQYLRGNPTEISENTVYEISLLSDVLAELSMLDIDVSELPKSHNPLEAPPIPPRPTDYHFLFNDKESNAEAPPRQPNIPQELSDASIDAFFDETMRQFQ